MNRQKTPVIFLICLLAFLSCGIEELPYLPQVPESGIKTTFNNEADIYIPSNLLNGLEHYATGYVIFYKIYISNINTDTISEIINNNSNNNSRISNDYIALFSFIDPTNASSIPSLTTFSNMGYYELELENTNIKNTVLTKSGGTIYIQFPPASGINNKPYLYFSGTEYPLYRSNGGGTFNPEPDRYFLSSSKLKDYANAISNINADVSGQSGVSEHAYASMYIVAVGTNQNKGNFSRLYGKPTFISIFKLPEVN